MNVYGLVDIDNFTLFNHKYGYEQGNKVLESLESLINEILTPLFSKRVNSDEFIFKLNGSFEENDKILFDLLSVVNDRLGITISVGLKEADDKFNYKQNINKIMSAMLIAKRNGKNKICLI
ncbi:MAG: GGDEF domain-containing protein [Flavobacteriales bacterium]|nr:GGDEF domain-containing protein [Flavobacteriales bacterium]